MSFPSHPRAVVTGAGSGLGRALCLELAKRGARIVVSDVDVTAAAATVALLSGTEAHAMACDVTQADQVEQLAVEAERRFGGVDLVINNAGVAAGGNVGDVTLANWKWVIDIDLWGPIYGCHVFAPRLRRQGSGHILNVASAAGLLSSPTMGPYNVAKAGVVALSETLYSELQGTGVGVSVLCPTFFQTNIANASRLEGDPVLRDLVNTLMTRAKIQAADVARMALDACQRDDLYVLPHGDGRWAWRVKRMNPTAFHRITPKLLAARAGRRSKP